ncbi:putative nwd2 protein [Mycena venus]|uniref:Putative nwd2 protein n=1 Tax=Mycena venus TaxID=2733690 RepID=A0A8H6XZE9_9AGAR|nr:putative nwd2 protein [Mycena venus]
MAFFNNGSGFVFHGGSFYNAGGDVIVQDNQQLMIGAGELSGSRALDHGSTGNEPLAMGWHGWTEGASSSEQMHGDRTRVQAKRFSPYDIGSRTRPGSLQLSSQPNSYHPEDPIAASTSANYPHVEWGQYLEAIPGEILASGEHSRHPSELPSAAKASSTSVFAPAGVRLPDNSEPSSRHYSDTAHTPEFPPDIFRQQHLGNPTIHTQNYAQPHPGDDAAVFSPQARWQNAFPNYQQPTAFHNGTFVAGNVNNTMRNGESGLNILDRISALEASHDPADSLAQPRCHPKTRIKMQETLCKWCMDSEWSDEKSDTDSDESIDEVETDSDESIDEMETDSEDVEPSILWVHGPAGAGKSAIMTTLAQRLEDERRLGGAFFFKRGHPTRGNAKFLFGTIALQLAVNSPQLKFRISQAVEENPTLVRRSMGVQLRELILRPCTDLQSPPWTVIIDGLDECEGHDVQQEILRLIGDAAHQKIPLRFIVASRPEAHIREVWNASSLPCRYRKFNVEGCLDDVRIYLVAEFARIHSEHSTMATVPTPWPSPHVIDRLVRKSSGYFIYAKTVVKFVDDKNFRPIQRLKDIENLTGTGSQTMFDALDELYTQILCVVPQHHLVPMLRVLDNFGAALTTSEIDTLLGLEPGDAALSLRGLYSVLTFYEDRPSFSHASFSDFLRDPSRAGRFYTDESARLTELARSVLPLLSYTYQDRVKNRNRGLIRLWWKWNSLSRLLIRTEPSHELLPSLRAVNLDVLEPGATQDILPWLKRIQPPPEDLLRVWRDSDYVSDLRLSMRNDEDGLLPVPWRLISGQVMDQVAHVPLLLYIAGAMLWVDYINLIVLRHILNVSWDEFLTALCRLRPIMRSAEINMWRHNMCQLLAMIIHDWTTSHQGTWRANICSRLARGCIRVRKLIDNGDLPERGLWEDTIPWGLLIRASPICAELLRGVQEFVPPTIPRHYESIQQEHECYDVIMWLKGFPEPPLDEINRWHDLFWNERRAASERPEYNPPNDYEERWREWDQKYPE